MDLQKQLIAIIKKENLFHAGDKLLLAVSGGLDSSVLTHLLHVAGYDIELMHVNFQLRAEESNRDEAFVRSLAEKYGVPFHTTRFNTKDFAATAKLSIQVAARELRYQWFHEIRSQINDKQSWIVTAHHLDDNLETAFMNWVKGTGIHGLRGMLPSQNAVVRPLLFARRSDLELYAKEHQLEWVEDSSNQEDYYTRNFMRHQVMPLLEKMYPQTQENLAANLERFREAELLYEQAMQVHRKALLIQKENEWLIPVEKLRRARPLQTIFFELVKPFGFRSSQLGDLLQLLDSDSGRHIDSKTHQVIRHRNWLVIAPISAPETSIIIIDGTGHIEGTNFDLHITLKNEVPKLLDTAPEICFIPAKLIQFPMLLRRWKTGDYFYPLGMPRKKKLARFFIDQKLSKTAKEKQWVLEMDGKIVWLPGLRLDNRFKITNGTESVYQFELSRK